MTASLTHAYLDQGQQLVYVQIWSPVAGDLVQGSNSLDDVPERRFGQCLKGVGQSFESALR